MKNILIIPSWYATEDAPTSGSFFHEQSLLLEDRDIGSNQWEVQVLTTKKNWISRQRHWYYKLLPKKNPLAVSDQYLTPPKGVVIEFPFCKFVSDEINLKREVASILQYYNSNLKQLPNIIHAHSALKGGIIARYLSEELDVPYLITEHMNPFLLHRYSDFWKNEIIQSLECANTVLAVSNHQKQQLLIHELKCNPIVTGNLVDDKRFFIKNHTNQNAEFLIVTFYPNFIKDMDTFFESILLLKNTNNLTQKHFTIVGGGELSGEISPNYYKKKVEELGIQEWVTIIPKANRTEMVNLMQQTDALISTSISESFGVAICEAMLCGKPVITTLNGGVNDYISKKNAISIPIKNPKALFNAILCFEETKADFDPEIIRQIIVEKYGRKTFRERIDDIYYNLLN